MKAFLINPWNRTITEVSHSGGIDDIYAKLSSAARPVDGFDMVTLNHNNMLAVDGEGFICGTRIPVWEWKGYAGKLCGIGLVLGYDNQGKTVAATLSREEITANVTWTQGFATGQMAGAGPTRYGYTMGQPVIVTEESE